MMSGRVNSTGPACFNGAPDYRHDLIACDKGMRHLKTKKLAI
jgi:hypothetical protein